MNFPDGFVKVCNINELKDEEGKQFFVDDVEIALFKVKNRVFAVSNICPHQKTHLMYDGIIENEFVICPLHGWKFNLYDGSMPNGRRGIGVYEVIVLGDDVYVKVDNRFPDW